MSTFDPDHKAVLEAAGELQASLKSSGVIVNADIAEKATHAVISRWIQGRSYFWALRRGAGGAVPLPDFMAIGFAHAALPRIADAMPNFDWSKSMSTMSPDDAAMLFAFAHAHIQAVSEQTLEDPYERQAGLPI